MPQRRCQLNKPNPSPNDTHPWGEHSEHSLLRKGMNIPLSSSRMLAPTITTHHPHIIVRAWNDLMFISLLQLREVEFCRATQLEGGRTRIQHQLWETQVLPSPSAVSQNKESWKGLPVSYLKIKKTKEERHLELSGGLDCPSCCSRS